MNTRWESILVTGALLIAATAIAQEAPAPEYLETPSSETSEARAASITLNPPVNPPTTSVKVQGSGYRSGESVKLTFDGSKVGKATADARGKFNKKIVVPSSALPGNHTVEAKGLSSGFSSRATFTARTDWLQGCFDASRSCFNAYENLLSAENVAGIIVDWKTAAASDGTTAPAYGNGMVYAGTRDGVHALNPATGQTMWTFSATGPFSSPAVIKGFNPQPDPPGKILATSMNGNLYALNSTDGRLLWSVGIGATQVSPMISCLPPGPCKVIVPAGDTLFAFDENGNRLWATVLGGVVAKATALLVNPPEPEKIIVPAGNTLSAVNLADGTVAWSVAPSRSFLGAPTIGDPGLFVGDEAGTLFSIDPADGSIAASLVLPGAGGAVSLAFGPTTDFQSGIVAVDEGGHHVTVVEVSGFSVTWQVDLGFPITAPPAVANGVISVAAQAGPQPHLFALEAETGDVLLDMLIGTGSLSAPIVADGLVLMGSGDGNLYRLSVHP